LRFQSSVPIAEKTQSVLKKRFISTDQITSEIYSAKSKVNTTFVEKRSVFNLKAKYVYRLNLKMEHGK